MKSSYPQFPERRSMSQKAKVLLKILVSVVVLVLATNGLAANPTPYKLASDWQFKELAGTEFATHWLIAKDNRFFIVRQMMPGELFERIVAKYCAEAKIGSDDCSETAKLAQELHRREHWHRNWEVNDVMHLLIPEAAYKPKQ